MVDEFVMTFRFEDDCPHVDPALNIVNKNIFENEVPGIWQPHWAAQIQNLMECYNLTAEEDEYPLKIDIKELEGHCKVNGPEMDMLDIM